jgi:hypothetical protein
MNSKWCRDCGVYKPLTDFSPSKKNRDGATSYCRSCFAVRAARYREAARGRPSSRARAAAAPEGEKWCPRCESYRAHADSGSNRSTADGLTAYCRVCHNAVGRENRVRLHGSPRDYRLKARYGITAADDDAMFAAQGGLCACCQDRPAEHVDHDHRFGNVRGLLCSCCNQGLGSFRDHPRNLRRAIDYLERTTWTRHQVATGVYQLRSPRPAAAASPSSSGSPRPSSSPPV